MGGINKEIFARIAAFLFENARLELISKQFGTPVEELEQDYLPADPTNGKYLTWILRQVREKKLIFPEDADKVRNRLSQFMQLSRKPAFQGEKDLNRYKSFGDLVRTLDQNSGVKTKGEITRERVVQGAQLLKEWVNVNEDGDKILMLVYAITTWEALDAMGAQQTEWCVRDKKWFDDYADEGLPFYLLMINYGAGSLSGDGTADLVPWQLLHLPSKQCMDRQDEPTSPKYFVEAGIEGAWEIMTPSDMSSLVNTAFKNKDEAALDKITGVIGNMMGETDNHFEIKSWAYEPSPGRRADEEITQAQETVVKLYRSSSKRASYLDTDAMWSYREYAISNHILRAMVNWSVKVRESRWEELEKTWEEQLNGGKNMYRLAELIDGMSEYAVDLSFRWPEFEEDALEILSGPLSTPGIASALAYYWANVGDGEPWGSFEEVWRKLTSSPNYQYNFTQRMGVYMSSTGSNLFAPAQQKAEEWGQTLPR